MHRSLYDQDFLDSGCTLPFKEVELTNTDNTLATYVTNYIVLITSLIFGALLFQRHKRATNQKFVSLYFVCTGIGFGVAGVGHQIVFCTDDSLYIVLTNISYVSTVFGLVFLQLIGVSFFLPYNKIIFSLLLLLSLAVIVTGPIISDSNTNTTFLMQGAMGLLASILVVTAYLVQAVRDGPKYRLVLIGKTISILLQVSSFVVQISLAGVCGRAAYEVCFEKCPLPLSFNHNAVFHAIYWIGFVGYGICEWIYPSRF